VDVGELSERLLALAAPVTLVVDGADRVRDETVFGQLARLVQSAGDRLRLVLITRAAPLMPLHRHRLEGTLAEIRSHELAFTPSEVRAVLAAHGLPASQRMAEHVLRRTEGWPAGVRMAALALRDGGDGDPLDADGADYLRAEVLDPMTGPDREFLATVGVVETIDRGLAARLSGRADADEVLTRMTRSNTFVQKVDGRPAATGYIPSSATCWIATCGAPRQAASRTYTDVHPAGSRQPTSRPPRCTTLRPSETGREPRRSRLEWMPSPTFCCVRRWVPGWRTPYRRCPTSSFPTSCLRGRRWLRRTTSTTSLVPRCGDGRPPTRPVTDGAKSRPP
jgi:hypothetical protein